MKTITYTNNQELELKINKFSSGQFRWAFSLTFNNGVHTFCYTMMELRTILLKNGMTRKWAANVKDRFDPLTEEHVLINRYRTPGGSEMEVFITSRFQRTENLPMCSAQNLSPCLVGGTTKPKFGNGRKGHVSIRLSRS